jgi:hypothetical protein
VAEPFATDKAALPWLLAQIAARDLALPDFQRDFVWDPDATEELLESVFSEYPTGSLLLMRHRDDGFAPRPFAGAPDLAAHDPARLVLDGQQRLTSLYQSLYGVGDYQYFLSLAVLDSGGSIEQALFHDSAKRALKLKMDSIAYQASNLILPLSEAVRDNAGLLKWSKRVREFRRKSLDPNEDIEDKLSELYGKWIAPLLSYQYPYVELRESTSMLAICRIFETLNRTGVKLTVFELLAARYFARDVRLRDLWLEARNRWPILDEFDVDPVYILQAIALRTSRGKPSCTRSDLLALTAADVQAHWQSAAEGFASVLDLLRTECGVLTDRWLPYGPQLIAPAAVWNKVVAPKNAASGANRLKVVRWFWHAAFAQDYESAANTQASKDFGDLATWLDGGPPTPTVQKSVPIPNFHEITDRQRGLYRTTMALIARHGARDFHKVKRLTAAAMREQVIDDHHVFPRGYLASRGYKDEQAANSILNRTLIDKQTNIRIGKKAPSLYLAEMEQELGQKELADLLSSHMLPTDPDSPLRRDSFEDFLAWRSIALSAEFMSAIGEQE